MKKIFLFAITLLCAAILTACGAANAEYPGVPHTECTEFTDWEVNSEPTCTEVGQKYRFCLECGTEQYESIPALGHTEEIEEGYAPTCTDEGATDTVYCAVCYDIVRESESIPALGHTPQGGETTEATCEEWGITTAVVCTVCDETLEYESNYPPLGHNYEHKHVPTSCTGEGYDEHTCTECSHTYKDNYVAKLNHSVKSLSSVIPTCTTSGLTEGSYCSECGMVIVAQVLIPATGHVSTEIKELAPTCDEEGHTGGSACSVCNAVLTAPTVIPAIGHSYVHSTVAPSCAERGYTEHACTVCDHSYRDSYVNTLDHTETVIPGYSATCTEIGFTNGKRCTVCNQITLEQQIIPAVGHVEYTVNGTAATCTKAGISNLVGCSVCGEVLVKDEVIEALGHKYVDRVIAPTCTVGGHTEHVCARCDDSYTDSFTTATGHTEVIVPYKAPTCTAAGSTEGSRCGSCGTVFTASEAIPALGHTERVLNPVAATCNTEGLTEGADCALCGTVIREQKKTSRLDHLYEGAVTLPTCTLGGYTTFTCKLCSHFYIGAQTEAKGHVTHTVMGKAATCTESGLTDGIECTTCGTTVKAQQTLAPLGHTVVTDLGTPATCTAPGLTDGSHCSVCNEVFIPRTVLNALGHTERIIPASAPTCYDAGWTEGRVCDVCDEVLLVSEILEATGHNYVTTVIPPTCTSQGYTRKTCACGSSSTYNYVSSTGHSYGEWHWNDSHDKGIRSCDGCGAYYGIASLKAEYVATYHNFAGENLAPYMISVRATYDGGSEVGLSSGEYEIVDPLLVTPGTETVTIRYFEHEVIISVPVLYAPLPGTTPASLFTYTTTNNEITITGYTGSFTDIVIPSFIGRVPVTAIAKNAFKGNTVITSVQIPGSVKTVGYYAFSGCTALTSLTLHEGISTLGYGAFYQTPIVQLVIPDSITAINSSSGTSYYGAFEGCTSLVEVVIGDSLATITRETFSGCTALKKVTIGNGVVTVDTDAFAGCTSLTDIIFGSSVATIGTEAFLNCTALKELNLNEGLVTVGNYAFQNCIAIETLTLPSTVQAIGYYAFNNCDGMVSIELNEGLKTIERAAFMSCNALKTLRIPDSVTNIYSVSSTFYYGAFSNCTSLVEVVIGDSLSTITPETFSGCTSLKKVTIGGGVNLIGVAAFSGCTALTDIIFGSSVATIGESAFEGCTALTTVTMPASLKTVGTEAFLNCTALKELNLNEGLVTVGNYAFQNCIAIESISLPSTVQTIGYYAFNNCDGMVSIELNEGLKTIERAAFMSCNALKTLRIPDSVTNIYSVSSTFYFGAFSNCTSLVEVVIGDSLATITPETFSGCTSLKKVTIGGGVNLIDVAAFSGCTSLTDIIFGSSVATIGESAFEGCTALTTVTMPASLKIVGTEAFLNCKALKDVYFNEGLVTVGNYAFQNCIAIETLTLPSTVQAIGYYAFNNCDGMVSIELNEGLKTIDRAAFMSCNALKSIRIPDSVTNIYSSSGTYYYGAFSNCTSLVEVVIGDSIATITPETFLGCTALKRVVIGDNVTVIDVYAFDGCISLEDIDFNSNLRTISNYAFRNCRALVELILPASVQVIGDHAFDGCSSLEVATLSESVQSIGQYAFGNCASLDTVTIPGNRLNTVKSNAFYSCGELKRIYYGGTEEKWSTVTVDSKNGYPINVTPYYYSATAPAKEGNYWFYGKENTALVWNTTADEFIADGYTSEFATGLGGSDNAYIYDYVSELTDDVGFVASVTAWETLHIVTSPSYLLEDGVLSRRDIYRIALFDVMGISDNGLPLIYDMLDTEAMAFMAELGQLKTGDIVLDTTLADNIKAIEAFGDIAEAIDIFISASETVEEALDSIVKYRALVALRTNFEAILNEISTNTSNNSDLRGAAQDCIEIMQAGCDDAMTKLIKGELVDNSLQLISGILIDTGWDALINFIPGGSAVALVGMGIRVLGNELFNMDAYIQAYYVMDSTRYLQAALRRCIINGTVDPLRYENRDKVDQVINTGLLLEKAILKGYEYAANFATEYGDVGRAVNINWEKNIVQSNMEDYRDQLAADYEALYNA